MKKILIIIIILVAIFFGFKYGILSFSKRKAKKLSKETGLRILDTHERSRAIVLGKNKKDLKIKKNEI